MTDLLGGLDADPWEREQLAEVLQEIGAEYGYPGGDGDGDGDGPWHDFNDATAQMDAAHELDGQRIGEDIVAELERRPSSESRLERALSRIEAGTYTEAGYFRGDPPARNAHGQFAPPACGDADDLGYCTSRYHDPGCSATVAQAAATGSAAEAEAWRDTLAHRTPDPGAAPAAEALGLSSPGGDTGLWADLLTSGTADPGLHERMMAYLTQAAAEQDGAVAPAAGRPDVSGLRAALGL